MPRDIHGKPVAPPKREEAPKPDEPVVKPPEPSKPIERKRH